MGNDEHRRPCETLLDGLCDLGVHLHVHRTGRFVHHQDSRVLEQRPSEAQKLSLALREIRAFCESSAEI